MPDFKPRIIEEGSQEELDFFKSAYLGNKPLTVIPYPDHDCHHEPVPEMPIAFCYDDSDNRFMISRSESGSGYMLDHNRGDRRMAAKGWFESLDAARDVRYQFSKALGLTAFVVLFLDFVIPGVGLL